MEEVEHTEGLEEALDFDVLETEHILGQVTYEQECGRAKCQEPPVGHRPPRWGAGLQSHKGEPGELLW